MFCYILNLYDILSAVHARFLSNAISLLGFILFLETLVFIFRIMNRRIMRETNRTLETEHSE